MTSPWTYERVERLAPDKKSVLAAQPLAFASRWQGVGRFEDLLWGVTRGSRGSTRHVVFRMSAPSGHEYSCTCPSRKRPCKHVLALLFLLAQRPESIPLCQAPTDWVLDWVAEKAARAERRAARQSGREETDPATLAKRAEGVKKREQERDKRMRAGARDLARLLRDIVRQGVAEQAQHSYRHWDEMAARMIDAQVPGLARMVRGLAGIPHTGEGWASRFLERLARIHLLVEAFLTIDTLPDDVADEVRALVGYKRDRASLAARDGIQDRWWVLGDLVQRSVEDEELWSRRTWLFGEQNEREALVLEFQFGGEPMLEFVPGTCVFTELVPYPGSWPIRVLNKRPPEMITRDVEDMAAHCDSIQANFGRMSTILETQPWATRFCARVADVVVVRTEQQGWFIRDDDSQAPLDGGDASGWQLLALSGGRPVSVLGDWTSDVLTPHAVIADGRYVPIQPTRPKA